MNKTSIRLYFEELDSTNTYAKEHDLPGGALVIAKMQSQGRGRRGHDFYSPEGGIYFSYVKRDVDEAKAEYLTVRAAAAVALALERLGMNPKIKWVNDIYIEDRKVCGILCERAGRPGDFYYMIGIGINLSVEGFPKELEGKAGALSRLDALGQPIQIEKEALIDSIIETFEELSDAKAIVEIYKTRSYLSGKKITFERNGVLYCGIAEGYNDSCNLLVRLQNNELVTLSSGEVFVAE